MEHLFEFFEHMASLMRFFPVLLVLILTLLTGCEKKPEVVVMPPAAVAIVPVTTAPFKEKSIYLGNLKSRKSVSLSPNIEGNVTSIRVTAGQSVKAGEEIMRIDSLMQTAQANAVAAGADSVQSDLGTAEATLRSLQSTLQSKIANVDFARTQFQRYTTLRAQGAVSQSELDTWKNSMAVAEGDRDSVIQQIEAQKMTIQKYQRSHKQALSNWEAQKEQLKYYYIKAPFTGVVGDIPVKLGDHVSQTTVLTTLTENHPLEVYISIPAEKASLMKQGMNVDLLSADGRLFGESKLIFISPTVDPASQTVLVKTLFPNSRSELRADQTVKAQVVWRMVDGISIPTKAVVQTAGKYFVFVAKNEGDKLLARQVEIEVLEIEGDSYQVKSGLKPTDRIITSGIQRLADGAPIADRSAMEGKTALSKQNIH